MVIIGGGFKGLTAAVNLAAKPGMRSFVNEQEDEILAMPPTRQIVLVEREELLLRSLDDIAISREMSDAVRPDFLSGRAEAIFDVKHYDPPSQVRACGITPAPDPLARARAWETLSACRRASRGRCPRTWERIDGVGLRTSSQRSSCA